MTAAPARNSARPAKRRPAIERTASRALRPSERTMPAIRCLESSWSPRRASGATRGGRPSPARDRTAQPARGGDASVTSTRIERHPRRRCRSVPARRMARRRPPLRRQSHHELNTFVARLVSAAPARVISAIASRCSAAALTQELSDMKTMLRLRHCSVEQIVDARARLSVGTSFDGCLDIGGGGARRRRRARRTSPRQSRPPARTRISARAAAIAAAFSPLRRRLLALCSRIANLMARGRNRAVLGEAGLLLVGALFAASRAVAASSRACVVCAQPRAPPRLCLDLLRRAATRPSAAASLLPRAPRRRRHRAVRHRRAPSASAAGARAPPPPRPPARALSRAPPPPPRHTTRRLGAARARPFAAVARAHLRRPRHSVRGARAQPAAPPLLAAALARRFGTVGVRCPAAVRSRAAAATAARSSLSTLHGRRRGRSAASAAARRPASAAANSASMAARAAALRASPIRSPRARLEHHRLRLVPRLCRRRLASSIADRRRRPSAARRAPRDSPPRRASPSKVHRAAGNACPRRVNLRRQPRFDQASTPAAPFAGSAAPGERRRSRSAALRAACASRGCAQFVGGARRRRRRRLGGAARVLLASYLELEIASVGAPRRRRRASARRRGLDLDDRRPPRLAAAFPGGGEEAAASSRCCSAVRLFAELLGLHPPPHHQTLERLAIRSRAPPPRARARAPRRRAPRPRRSPTPPSAALPRRREVRRGWRTPPREACCEALEVPRGRFVPHRQRLGRDGAPDHRAHKARSWTRRRPSARPRRHRVVAAHALDGCGKCNTSHRSAWPATNLSTISCLLRPSAYHRRPRASTDGSGTEPMTRPVNVDQSPINSINRRATSIRAKSNLGLSVITMATASPLAPRPAPAQFPKNRHKSAI